MGEIVLGGAAEDEAEAPPPGSDHSLLVGTAAGTNQLLFRPDGTVWQGHRLVLLPPLQQRLMRCFCLHAGEVVTRDELIEQVWGAERVSEQRLARAIHLLRRLLADCGLGSRSISTLYGCGYIFTLPVQAIDNAGIAPSLAEGGRPAGAEDPAGASPATPATDVSEPSTARGAQVETTDAPKEIPAREPHTPAPPPASSEERLLAQEHLNEAHHRLQRHNPAVLTAALRHLHEAERLLPGQARTRLTLCRCLLQTAAWGLRDSRECARAIQTLTGGYPVPEELRDPWQAAEAETLSLLLWQPQACEQRYGPALAAIGQREEGLWVWARHLLATGRAAEAHAHIQPHLRPQLPRGWLLAAACLWVQDDAEAAQRMLLQRLALDPDDVGAHLLLSLIRCQLGLTREAGGVMEQITRMTRRSMPLQGRHQLLLRALAGGSDGDDTILMLQELLREDRLPWPSLWALAALRSGARTQAGIWFDPAVESHCPLAPFLWHSPLLRPFRNHPALRRFSLAMVRFRAPEVNGQAALLLG